MIRMMSILVALWFCAGSATLPPCRRPLKTEQDFILRAKQVATASPECADILARFPTILEHPQILPSQAPTISVRFDHADVKTLQTLGSIIVNMSAPDGTVDGIDVKTFPVRLK
ncbi:MAG: hypothetical protein U1G05_03225 [Kiritimatiellia bacterium]